MRARAARVVGLLFLLLQVLAAHGYEARGKQWALREASGLAASRRHAAVLYSHNDSGDGPHLYALNATDGSLLAVYRVTREGDGPAANRTAVDARDWEDMAVGPCPVRRGVGEGGSCLYVGDIGDNTGLRSTKQVYVVPEPTAFPSGGPNVTHDLGPARRIDLAAPSNFGGQIDSESLMVDPVGDLYLVRKNFKSPLTVFRARAEALRGAGAADTVWMEDFFTPSRSVTPSSGNWTSADISPSGLGMLVKDCEYMRPRREGRRTDWKKDEDIYYYRRDSLDHEWFADGYRSRPPYHFEHQGEAVAWAADESGYFTLSEGLGSELRFYPFPEHKAFAEDALAGFPSRVAAAFVERATATIDALAEFFADQNRRDPCLADLDTTAVSGNSCREFKGWGKCEESWLVQGGFCGHTCGRCRIVAGRQDAGEADSAPWRALLADRLPAESGAATRDEGGASGAAAAVPLLALLREEAGSEHDPGGRRLN